MNNPREGMDEPLIANSNAMGWPKKVTSNARKRSYESDQKKVIIDPIVS